MVPAPLSTSQLQLQRVHDAANDNQLASGKGISLRVHAIQATHLRLLCDHRARKLHLSSNALGLLDKPKRPQRPGQCRQRAAEYGLPSMRWLEVGAGNGRLTWHLRAALRALERHSMERLPTVHLACCDSGLNELHEGTACGCARGGRQNSKGVFFTSRQWAA